MPWLNFHFSSESGALDPPQRAETMSVVSFFVLNNIPQRFSEVPLYREKLSHAEGSLAYPGYPRQAKFSYTSLQNFAIGLHKKQKLTIILIHVCALIDHVFCVNNCGITTYVNFFE